MFAAVLQSTDSESGEAPVLVAVGATEAAARQNLHEKFLVSSANEADALAEWALIEAEEADRHESPTSAFALWVLPA